MGTAARGSRLLAIAAAVALAACSSDDDDRSSDTAAATTSAAAPTTAAETTTAETTTSPSTLPSTTSTAAIATSTTAPPPTGTFVEGPCATAPSIPDRVTCGVLEVPERHGATGGPTIGVAVAIVEPAATPSGPEPLVFLAGGPGYGSTGAIEAVLADPPAPRTIVLVDYRGVGDSVPSLACPENDELAIPALALSAVAPAIMQRWRDALVACHDRLVAEGIDLAAYNYEEIAADLEALRAALGYEQWDLWGLSNGGRVALEVVRRYPAGVRALVLDAPSPPQANLWGDLWPNASAAFDRLFARCAADPACGPAFPDLQREYVSLVGRLAESPVDVVVPGAEGGADVTVHLDQYVALNALREAMYETPLIPLLPYYIHQLAQGSGYDVVAGLIIDRSGQAGFSAGMALTVNCREELSFLPDGYFAAQAEDLPLFAPVLELREADDSCSTWDVGRGDLALNDPVVSDVPALLLVGEFDPVHPEATVGLVAEGLPNSTLVEFPGLGHGTIFVDPCPRSLVAPFLDDPTAPVDASCVDAMPAVAWLTG